MIRKVITISIHLKKGKGAEQQALIFQTVHWHGCKRGRDMDRQ